MPNARLQRYAAFAGIMLCCGGLAGLVVSIAMPANRIDMPFVESEWAKRTMAAGWGLMFIILGVAIARCRAWVLYALPVLLTVGIVVVSAGEANTFSPEPGPEVWVMLSGMVATLIAAVATLVGTRTLWDRDQRTAFLSRLSTEQRSGYTFSVAPLGIFLLCGGLIALALAFLLPGDRIHMPQVESELWRRACVSFTGLVFALLGIGLVRLWKWAWYTLLVWIAGMSLLVGALEIAHARSEPQPPLAARIGQSLFGLVVCLGVWYVTRQAFSQSGSRGDRGRTPDAAVAADQ